MSEILELLRLATTAEQLKALAELERLAEQLSGADHE